MLELIFTILLVILVFKLFMFGIRASWGIIKILCSTLIFPILLVGMVFAGLIYLAFLLLLVVGIYFILTSLRA